MAAMISARSLSTHVCAIAATLAASVPVPAFAEPLDLRYVAVQSGPHGRGAFRDNLRVGMTLRLPLDGGLAPDPRRTRFGFGLAMRNTRSFGGDFGNAAATGVAERDLFGGVPVVSVEFRVAVLGDPVLNGLALSDWRRLYAEETGAEDEGGSNALWWILGGVGLAAGAGIAIGASASKTGEQLGESLSHAFCKALGGTNCPPPEGGG